MPDAPARYGWPPRLLRAPAAAYYLGMSETSFRERVPVEPVRIGGMVAWRREDLDAWVDQQAGGAPASPVNPWHAPPP